MIKFVTNVTGMKEVHAEINKATESIDILCPWITFDTIHDLISREQMSELKARRIKARAVMRFSTDFDASMMDEAAFGFFIKAFDELRINPGIHSKIIIVDRRVALVSSMNMTSGGFADQTKENPRERDSGILTDDPEAVNGAILHFDNVWEASQNVSLNEKPLFLVLSKMAGRKSIVAFLGDVLKEGEGFVRTIAGIQYDGRVISRFPLPRDLTLPKLFDAKNWVHSSMTFSASVRSLRYKTTNVEAALVSMDSGIWEVGDLI